MNPKGEFNIQMLTEKCYKGPGHTTKDLRQNQSKADFEQGDITIHHVDEPEGFNSVIIYTVNVPDCSSAAIITDVSNFNDAGIHLQICLRGAAEAEMLLSSLKRFVARLEHAGYKDGYEKMIKDLDESNQNNYDEYRESEDCNKIYKFSGVPDTEISTNETLQNVTATLEYTNPGLKIIRKIIERVPERDHTYIWHLEIEYFMVPDSLLCCWNRPV